MRENNLKDKNMPSIKGMEGGLTIRTYRCGGDGGGGEEDFKNYTKNLRYSQRLGFWSNRSHIGIILAKVILERSLLVKWTCASTTTQAEISEYTKYSPESQTVV